MGNLGRKKLQPVLVVKEPAQCGTAEIIARWASLDERFFWPGEWSRTAEVVEDALLSRGQRRLTGPSSLRILVVLCAALPSYRFPLAFPGFFMAYDDQDDLFVEDFDFVDEDEEDNTPVEEAQQEPVEESEDKPTDQSPTKPRRRSSSRGGKRGAKQKPEPEAQESAETEEKAEEEGSAPVEEPKEPVVPTDHVVHIYEFGKFTRTINREFTSDDAEAFVVEYNRTSSAHCRQAMAAGRDDIPAEAL